MTKKKLARAEDWLHALIEEPGNITHNTDEVTTEAERFYTSQARSEGTTEHRISASDAHLVTKEKFKTPSRAWKEKKTAGNVAISGDRLKKGGYIELQKLADLFY